MKGVILSAVFVTLAFAQSDAVDERDSYSNPNAVFVMTNAADDNQILSYLREKDGKLKFLRAFHTGGRGSGGTTDPLGSQGALILSQDHSLLLAVNAGSGDISSFIVNGANLSLAAVTPSGGSAPVAVAQWGDLVYVLNFAGNSNVVGFRLNDGQLMPIHDSIRYLTSANSGASSLVFSPDGQWLIATEKLTNNIDAFPVHWDGTLGKAVVTNDLHAGLFATVFTPNEFLVSVEAGAGTVSSFLVDANGNLASLDSGVPTHGAAACWIAATPDGRFVYTSNSGSANLSGYSMNSSGKLTAVGATIVGSNAAGSINLDIAISGDGRYLYTLNSGTGTIGIFAIEANGKLKALGSKSGLPVNAGIQGLAAL